MTEEKQQFINIDADKYLMDSAERILDYLDLVKSLTSSVDLLLLKIDNEFNRLLSRTE